jgi:hypothetical protein
VGGGTTGGGVTGVGITGVGIIGVGGGMGTPGGGVHTVGVSGGAGVTVTVGVGVAVGDWAGVAMPIHDLQGVQMMAAPAAAPRMNKTSPRSTHLSAPPFLGGVLTALTGPVCAGAAQPAIQGGGAAAGTGWLLINGVPAG